MDTQYYLFGKKDGEWKLVGQEVLSYSQILSKYLKSGMCSEVLEYDALDRDFMASHKNADDVFRFNLIRMKDAPTEVKALLLILGI